MKQLITIFGFRLVDKNVCETLDVDACKVASVDVCDQVITIEIEVYK